MARIIFLPPKINDFRPRRSSDSEHLPLDRLVKGYRLNDIDPNRLQVVAGITAREYGLRKHDAAGVSDLAFLNDLLVILGGPSFGRLHKARTLHDDELTTSDR